MRRWKLLKDLPWAKAGTESHEQVSTDLVVFGDRHTMYVSFQKEFLEQHPDWFEEIKPRRVLVVECELPMIETNWKVQSVRIFSPNCNYTLAADVLSTRIEERD